MIYLSTDCNKSIHRHVCASRNNAKNDMKKLKNLQYGKGPNDNYDWETMTTARRVDIEFSCRYYAERGDFQKGE